MRRLVKPLLCGMMVMALVAGCSKKQETKETAATEPEEFVKRYLNHCMGFSFMWLKSSLFVGGCGALLRSYTLPVANTVPLCLFVFQEAMVASPEWRSYYGLDNVRSILDYIFKLLGE